MPEPRQCYPEVDGNDPESYLYLPEGCFQPAVPFCCCAAEPLGLTWGIVSFVLVDFLTLLALGVTSTWLAIVSCESERIGADSWVGAVPGWLDWIQIGGGCQLSRNALDASLGWLLPLLVFCLVISAGILLLWMVCTRVMRPDALARPSVAYDMLALMTSRTEATSSARTLPSTNCFRSPAWAFGASTPFITMTYLAIEVAGAVALVAVGPIALAINLVWTWVVVPVLEVPTIAWAYPATDLSRMAEALPAFFQPFEQAKSAAHQMDNATDLATALAVGTGTAAGRAYAVFSGLSMAHSVISHAAGGTRFRGDVTRAGRMVRPAIVAPEPMGGGDDHRVAGVAGSRIPAAASGGTLAATEERNTPAGHGASVPNGPGGQGQHTAGLATGSAAVPSAASEYRPFTAGSSLEIDRGSSAAHQGGRNSLPRGGISSARAFEVLLWWSCWRLLNSVVAEVPLLVLDLYLLSVGDVPLAKWDSNRTTVVFIGFVMKLIAFGFSCVTIGWDTRQLCMLAAIQEQLPQTHQPSQQWQSQQHHDQHYHHQPQDQYKQN